MDTKELLFKLLVEAKDCKMHIDDARIMSSDTDDEALRKAVNYITDYRFGGGLRTAIKHYLCKTYDADKYISVNVFRDELDRKLLNIKENLPGNNNGYIFSILLLATLLNWRELFDACEWQIEYNAQLDFELDINKEDIKKCVKYIIDNGRLTKLDFNDYYNNTLKQYKLY